MPNLKRFPLAHKVVGMAADPTIVIQRNSDSFFWEDGTGFIANGGSPVYNTMTEIFDDFWVYETDFEAWDNGLYNVLFTNGATAVAGGYSITVSGDMLIGFIEASSITAKNVVSSIKQSLQPILDAIVSLQKSTGQIADRVDSMNQTLSRRDYNSTGP